MNKNTSEQVLFIFPGIELEWPLRTYQIVFVSISITDT